MAFKVTIKKNADGSITRSVNGANSDQASNITTSKGTTVQTEIESITPYVKVTQAQYDALKSAGTLAKNTQYIITDKPYSADDVLDLATIKSRGQSGTLKASDVPNASAMYQVSSELSRLPFIGTPIYSFPSTNSSWGSWVATEDCIIAGRTSNNYAYPTINIDNITVSYVESGKVGAVYALAKRGQTISTRLDDNADVKAFSAN